MYTLRVVGLITAFPNSYVLFECILREFNSQVNLNLKHCVIYCYLSPLEYKVCCRVDVLVQNVSDLNDIKLFKLHTWMQVNFLLCFS